MRKVLLLPLAVIATLALLVSACGGDDDAGDAGSQAQPEVTQERSDTSEATGDPGDEDQDDSNGDDAPAPGGSGSAVLTIGDESWVADGIFCAFSTEDTRNENVPFTISGFTQSSTGARAQLDASVVDLSGSGEISEENLSVTLDDVEDFENPSVSWAANTTELFGGQIPVLTIDGKNVTIDAVFDDGLTEDEMEAVPGTLEATCP